MAKSSFLGGGKWLMAGGALAACGAGLPAVSVAQDKGSAQQIEEIIVTASRRTETLQDTPLSVATFDPNDLAVGGLTKLSDVLDYTPGVYFSGGSAPTHNTISMRGVSTFTSAPTVGTYIDDVPLGSSSGKADGAGLVIDAMKAGIERVEVIKGPQGTLYGASSMGGIVRYVTADPSRSEFSASIATDFSVTDHGGSNQKYTGRLSAPLVKDRVGLSLSGYYEDVGGFIDRIPQSASGAAKDVNGYENYGGLAKLGVNFTDRFSGSLLAMHDKVSFNGRNIVALDGGPPFVPANGPYDTDTAYSIDTSKFDLVGATLNYEFSFANLISSTSYQEREVLSTTDLVADFGPLVALFCGCTVNNAPFTGSTTTDRFVQELRLVSKAAEKAAGNIEWTVGGIYSKEESGNGQRLAGLPSNFLLLDVNIPSEVEETAAFANLTYYLTSDIDLTVGARIADVKASVEIVDGPQILLNNVPPTTVSDTVDTYSFSARYRPTDSLSLYGRIASGYRPAAANLPLIQNGQNAAPAIVKSDTLWSYEVGAKGYAPGGAFSYDLAAWYIKWKDLQSTIYVNGAQTGGNASSNVTAYGFESAFTWSPSDEFRLIGSLAYADSTLDSDETRSFGAVAGENMPGVPAWTYALRASRDFKLGENVDAVVNAGLRYMDDRDTGFEGGAGANGQVITPLIYNFVAEDHVVADMSLELTRGKLSGSLYATNLFDKYAYSGGSARPAAGFIRATANVIRPRTVGFTLNYKF
ncbi:MAG: TonB-dependent receptor [Steroidobacteraceae bacterium]